MRPGTTLFSLTTQELLHYFFVRDGTRAAGRGPLPVALHDRVGLGDVKVRLRRPPFQRTQPPVLIDRDHDRARAAQRSALLIPEALHAHVPILRSARTFSSDIVRARRDARLPMCRAAYPRVVCDSWRRGRFLSAG